MAEALSFILAEYTVPPDIPVIYITDSDNTRTLQRNLKFHDQFTHRKLIRYVKQGIDYPIANHLELLTSDGMQTHEMSLHNIDIYKKGERLC
jgi:hypothetical protein